MVLRHHHQKIESATDRNLQAAAEFTGLTEADLLTVAVGDLLPRIDRDGCHVDPNPDISTE